MTKRVHKSSDGKYHIAGKAFVVLVGSRAQVWHGTAYKTPGGLKKSDLLMNKLGRVVSAKKHATAKREKRLQKHGYTAKKGQFGAVKIGDKGKKGKRGKSTRKTRRRRRR